MFNNKVLMFFIFLVKISYAQQTIPLYPGKIPNSKVSANEEQITANDLVDTVSALDLNSVFELHGGSKNINLIDKNL